MKNVCIVGYGAIGPVHARALARIKNARLYAVCDNNPDRIRLCQESYDVKGYTDFDEMLRDEEIHSIHICTPHYLHYEMARKGILAGKDVISEKPVTMTKEEFESLLAMPGSEKIALVFQNRLNPCSLKLKELITANEQDHHLGNLICIKGIVTWYRSKAYYEKDSWRGKWATEGGGVLINQTVHTLDLMNYLAGHIRSVQCSMNNFSLHNVIEVEDTCTAHFQFKGGATGLFFATNAYANSTPPEIEIVFEKGIALYQKGKLYLNDQLICEDITATGEKAYWGLGHQGLISDFYDEGKYFGLESARNTMYTMFAMYESAAKASCPVEVKES